VVQVSDRLYVDVAALTRGGIDLNQWSTLADQIAGRVTSATQTYRYSGGTGEMGEQFDTNYKPGEAKALEFLALLVEIVGGYADRTLLAARTFDQTNTDADAAAPHE
jgi:hypothetical protein